MGHSKRAIPAIGVTDETDAVVARSFLAWASREQIPQARQMEMIKWWNVNGSKFLAPEKFEDLVLTFANQFPEQARSVAGWFDQVEARGVDSIPADADPTPEVDTQRERELDQLMRSSPAEYAANKFYELELTDIAARRIERQEGERLASQPSSIDSSPGETPPPPANGRAAEIEAVMKTSPAAYWGNPDMRREYANLMGAPNAGPAAPASPSPELSTDEGDTQ
jgi:hypothetical protein